MMRILRSLLPLLASCALATACSSGGDASTLCHDTFQPYVDLTVGQARTAQNGTFLDAMELYRSGNYNGSVDSLKAYLQRRDARVSARLYLACAYIALDRPYDAELELDKLEQSTTREFKDQCDWYTTVCWACSGQYPRALQGAREIMGSGRHTYAGNAADLIEALRSIGVE